MIKTKINTIINILKAIEQNPLNMFETAIKSKSSYSHLCKILPDLEKCKLLKLRMSTENNRDKVVSITDEGLIFLKLFENMKEGETMSLTINLTYKVLKVLQKRRRAMCIAEIHKETDITYSHLANRMSELVKKGFVTSIKTGRRRMIKITDEGIIFIKLLELN